MLKLRFAGSEEHAPDPLADRPSPVHVWFNRQGGVVARGFREAESYWMAWPYLATYQFSADSPFITAHPIPGAPVDVIWDVYRRSVVPMALQVLGWEALHASAIVTAKGIVAFCAVSETGKSTLAFGLRRRGFPQWSDDGVVLRMEGSAAMAEPLPFHARLRPQSQELFGEDGATRSVEGNSAGEQEFTQPLPVATICILKRSDLADDEQVARISPVPASAAFPELLVHAHEFDPHDPERRARMVQTYLELAAAVPVFEAAFVPDRSRLDALLDAVIDGLSLELPDGVQSRVP